MWRHRQSHLETYFWAPVDSCTSFAIPDNVSPQFPSFQMVIKRHVCVYDLWWDNSFSLLTKFRITIETCLLVCLWGCLTEDGSSTLNVGSIIPWGPGPNKQETKSWVSALISLLPDWRRSMITCSCSCLCDSPALMVCHLQLWAKVNLFLKLLLSQQWGKQVMQRLRWETYEQGW